MKTWAARKSSDSFTNKLLAGSVEPLEVVALAEPEGGQSDGPSISNAGDVTRLKQAVDDVKQGMLNMQAEMNGMKEQMLITSNGISTIIAALQTDRTVASQSGHPEAEHFEA